MTAIIADRELVYDGWYRLHRVTLRHDGGKQVERHIEDHGSAAAVLAYDPVRRMALVVAMPRAPVIAAGEAPFWEAIAGNLDGDSPEDCVRREAMEEAGVRLGTLEPVATIWSMPALSTERLHLYLAPYRQGDRTGAGGGSVDEGEMITVGERPLGEFAADMRDGRVADAKLLLLLQALMLKSPALFE